jgi:hypothetical protein
MPVQAESAGVLKQKVWACSKRSSFSQSVSQHAWLLYKWKQKQKIKNTSNFTLPILSTYPRTFYGKMFLIFNFWRHITHSSQWNFRSVIS